MNLLLVHGFLGSSLNWGPVIHRLRRHSEFVSKIETIVSPDLLGHGRKAESRVPSMAHIVENLIEEIPSGDFVALGHSFGLRPLLLVPDEVKARMKLLIAEDSSPVISESGFLELKEIFKNVPVPFSSRDLARDFLEKKFGKESRMARFLMTNVREMEPGINTWRFDASGLYQVLEESYLNPLWKEWQDIEAPIHCIFGGESSFVPRLRQEECVSRRPAKITQIYQIPQSGHWVHADQPELFCDQLVQIILANQVSQ